MPTDHQSIEMTAISTALLIRLISEASCAVGALSYAGDDAKSSCRYTLVEYFARYRDKLHAVIDEVTDHMSELEATTDAN